MTAPLERISLGAAALAFVSLADCKAAHNVHNPLGLRNVENVIPAAVRRILVSGIDIDCKKPITVKVGGLVHDIQINYRVVDLKRGRFITAINVSSVKVHDGSSTIASVGAKISPSAPKRVDGKYLSKATIDVVWNIRNGCSESQHDKSFVVSSSDDVCRIGKK